MQSPAEAETWSQQWRTAEGTGRPAGKEPNDDRTPVALAFLILLGFVLAGAAAISLSGGADGETATPAADAPGDAVSVEVDSAVETAPPTTTPTTVAPTTTAQPTTTVAPTTTETTTTTEPATTTTTQAPTTTAATADVALAARQLLETDVRTAVFSGGKVYLRGTVPAQEVADTIAQRAAAVLGPENVIVEYVIDPSAPLPDSAPLYVDDTILFETGSTVINGAFVPLLQLGTSLMQQNENVRITVIAHTDSTGSEEFNLELSQERADVVKEFWTEQGIDPSRIDAVGLGESAPLADNLSGQGRAANRRAEFIVQGILG